MSSIPSWSRLSCLNWPMRITLTFEGGGYVARSPDPEVASQGDTRPDAIRAFAEALEALEEEEARV